LSKGVVARLSGQQHRIEDIVAGFLYTVTVGVISIAMIIVSVPQIERALTIVFSREGSSVIVLIMIVFILILVYRYAIVAVRRLEETFQIEE